MPDPTRTTFKVTAEGLLMVDFPTLRKGDKFVLQDSDPLFGFEKGDVCNVALSDAYLRNDIWTIDCEEIGEEQIPNDPLGDPDCLPIVDDLPRVVATVQTAAAVLSAAFPLTAGGEE